MTDEKKKDHAPEGTAEDRIKEWEDRIWAQIQGHICSENDEEKAAMNEEKTIDEQDLEKATGGIFGAPGGPEMSLVYGVTRYRCPDCGRELGRSETLTDTPVCPNCGKKMLRV